MIIAGISDSDYSNCIDSRRSVLYYLFKFGNSTISWWSLKKKSVSISITEVEYVVYSKPGKHFVGLKTALKDFRCPEILMAQFCDNHSPIDLSENYRISELSNNIDIHHHWVQESVYHRSLQLIYIRTIGNLPETYTKGLLED
jgi:hypothetical protein